MGVLQVRVDDDLKLAASEILETIGLDLSTAIRMFLKKVIIERGLPFEPKIEQDLAFLMAVRSIQKHSEEIGISDMTLDEINKEIKLAREEKRKRDQ